MIILIEIQIVPSLASGYPFKPTFESFSHEPNGYALFLALWYDKKFQAHLAHFLGQPGVSHLSKCRFLFFNREMAF